MMTKYNMFLRCLMVKMITTFQIMVIKDGLTREIIIGKIAIITDKLVLQKIFGNAGRR